MQGTIICIQDPNLDEPRMITRITPLNSGGFAVQVPYHQANHGFLMKQIRDYGKIGLSHHPMNEETTFVVTARAKMSFHPSGLVHFSGPGIHSGIDPDTGAIRGIGVMGNPMSHPVSSGPTFGIVAWGLHEFEVARPKKSRKLMTFGSGEYYYDGCTPAECNGYHIEAFVFTNAMWPRVAPTQPDPTMRFYHPGFTGPRRWHQLRVIPLVGQNNFLGVMVSRMNTRFPWPSGYTMNGPSEYGRGNIKLGIAAMYPADSKFTGLESMDHKD